MKILLPVFYLPPISWFAAFLADEAQIVFEQYEHFPKQTFRNRANIYGANGRLALIVPMKHNGKREIKDMEISYAEPWIKNHWKSIKTAYQSSPYFEFYEDKLKKIYEKEEQNLLKFNLNALAVILDILKSEKAYSLNTEYIRTPEEVNLRDYFSAKVDNGLEMEAYYQTFSDKMGFEKDLSVLDLICNKGPESLTYIKNIQHQIFKSI